jgi:hypothetical protein
MLGCTNQYFVAVSRLAENTPDEACQESRPLEEPGVERERSMEEWLQRLCSL